MIYNLENTARIGKPVCVFDANGLEWYCTVEVDTETGRILKLKVDPVDNFVLIDPESHTTILEEIYAAAPLSVVPADQHPTTYRHNPSGWKYEGCTCQLPDGYKRDPNCPVIEVHKRDSRSLNEFYAFKKYNLPVSQRRYRTCQKEKHQERVLVHEVELIRAEPRPSEGA